MNCSNSATVRVLVTASSWVDCPGFYQFHRPDLFAISFTVRNLHLSILLTPFHMAESAIERSIVPITSVPLLGKVVLRDSLGYNGDIHNTCTLVIGTENK